MDIEGSEPLALEGMKSFIERNHDLVLTTECVSSYLNHDAAEDFLRKLARWGFQLTIVNEYMGQVETGSVQRILKRFFQKGHQINLLRTRGYPPLTRLFNNRQRGCGVPRVTRLVGL